MDRCVAVHGLNNTAQSNIAQELFLGTFPAPAPAPTTPQRGGAGRGQGRKARDGAQTERAELRLDPEARELFLRLGGGDLSLGAREAARRLRGLPAQDWTAAGS